MAMRKGQGRSMHARKTKRGVLIAALATLLLLTGASAASAIVPGGLVYNTCTTYTAVAGCGEAHDFGSALDIAVSPDGRNVYTIGTNTLSGGYSLLTFNRDGVSGELTQQGGSDGCIRSTPQAANCRSLTSLQNPQSIAITPDGRSVYVSTAANSQILEFDRAANGTLSAKTGSPCVTGSILSGCTLARALATPQGLAIDPQGRNLYVASALTDAVTALAIDPNTGALSQVNDGDSTNGCVQQVPDLINNCADGRGLD